MKSVSLTIQVKAGEQYFPVLTFIRLYNVVGAFDSVDKLHK